MDWMQFKGKKVFLKLKAGREYTGQIIDIDILSPPLVFLTIIDKYDKKVVFSSAEIKIIQEERR